MQNFDLKSTNNATQLFQIPQGAVLTCIDGKIVSSDNEINSIVNFGRTVTCEFALPNVPPSTPDFLVVECPQYASRGGLDIFRIEGSENLIPIPLKKLSVTKSLCQKSIKIFVLVF